MSRLAVVAVFVLIGVAWMVRRLAIVVFAVLTLFWALSAARAQVVVLTCAVAGPGPTCYAIANAGTGSTGAVVATLPARAGFTTYICGFDVSALGGTATVGPITVTGLVGAQTFTYQFSSTAAGTTLNRQYTPCIPANATNTTIVVTTTADGSATAVDVNAWGFQQ